MQSVQFLHKSKKFHDALFPTGTLISQFRRTLAMDILLRDIESITSGHLILFLLSVDTGDSVPFYMNNMCSTPARKQMYCSACLRTYEVSAPSGAMYGPCSHCDALESFTVQDISWSRTDRNMKLCYLKVQYVGKNTSDWLWCCCKSLHHALNFDKMVIPHSLRAQSYRPFAERVSMYTRLAGRLPDVLFIVIFEYIDI